MADDQKRYCAECGGAEGVIQHIDIAWPNGRHVELWLHPECEAEALERLEKQNKRTPPGVDW